MKTPVWLAEFHRRWHAARCRSTSAVTRAYGMSWPALLESVEISREEDVRTAVREAEALEAEGRLIIKRHRYRKYLIERIALPIEAEPWLRGVFSSDDPVDLLQRSLAVLKRHSGPLADRLREAFTAGRTIRPFTWRDPDGLDRLFTLTRSLATINWPPGTPVRTASTRLGLDSKYLECHQRTLARALTEYLGASTTLADLGLVLSESMLLTQGPLILHFESAEPKDFTGLAPHAISFADLDRAVRIETPCPRLLTIENAKTTFRQFAATNASATTLLVASSFPTPAVRALLEKLPPGIEHHHFGDTDPTGFQILAHLREISPRPVQAFHMKWRPAPEPRPLTPRDIELVGSLSEDARLKDCHAELATIRDAGDRGLFEQESLGPPDLRGWPFFSDERSL